MKVNENQTQYSAIRRWPKRDPTAAIEGAGRKRTQKFIGCPAKQCLRPCQQLLVLANIRPNKPFAIFVAVLDCSVAVYVCMYGTHMIA